MNAASPSVLDVDFEHQDAKRPSGICTACRPLTKGLNYAQILGSDVACPSSRQPSSGKQERTDLPLGNQDASSCTAQLVRRSFPTTAPMPWRAMSNTTIMALS